MKALLLTGVIALVYLVYFIYLLVNGIKGRVWAKEFFMAVAYLLFAVFLQIVAWTIGSYFASWFSGLPLLCAFLCSLEELNVRLKGFILRIAMVVLVLILSFILCRLSKENIEKDFERNWEQTPMEVVTSVKLIGSTLIFDVHSERNKQIPFSRDFVELFRLEVGDSVKYMEGNHFISERYEIKKKNGRVFTNFCEDE